MGRARAHHPTHNRAACHADYHGERKAEPAVATIAIEVARPASRPEHETHGATEHTADENAESRA
jgi:hypothetical protein